MKRIAWFTIVILATLGGLFLLWQMRVAVILFLLALTISAAIRPLVDRLMSRHLSKGLALLVTYALLVGAFIGLLLLIGGRVIGDIQEFMTDASSRYQEIQTTWPTGTPFQQVIAQQLAPLSDLSHVIAGQQGTAFWQTVLGFTLSSFDLLGQVIITLVLSIYWSADQERFKRLWLSLFPAEIRARTRESWQAIEDGVGAYVRSEFVQSWLALILLALGYSLLGLKYPILLALIGAIGWLIPWVGVLLAVIPALVVGLTMSPALGFGAAAYALAILSFLEIVVEPRFFNRRRFSSLLVVIVVLVLADEYGLLGVLLAPPLAAVIQITANQIIRSSTPSAATTPPVNQLEVLLSRLDAFQATLAQHSEAPSPEMVNLTDRLKRLIDRAREEEALYDRSPSERSGLEQLEKTAAEVQATPAGR